MQACLSLHLSKSYIVRNHMVRLIYFCVFHSKMRMLEDEKSQTSVLND